MHRLEQKEFDKRFVAFRDSFPPTMRTKITEEQFNNATVEAYRQPTHWEINFGYGAIHFKIFPLVVWVNPKTGGLKRWIKCQYDNLRYYR